MTRAEKEFEHWHRNADEKCIHKTFERESYFAGFKKRGEAVEEACSSVSSIKVEAGKDAYVQKAHELLKFIEDSIRAHFEEYLK